MTQRTAASNLKALPLRARACFVAALSLAVCLPASAAENTAIRKAPLSRSDDPFAVYDAALNTAASRALKNVDESHNTAPNAAIVRPPQANRASMLAPAGDSQASWQRVENLLPVIDPILNQVGVPAQLAAVVLVESGGNPMALSPKGARGLWQLMPDTARRYGLVVNAETDQRLDILKSTRAAAEYLRDLYAEFHDWPLALAAYNAGDEAVQRAITQTGGTAFSTAARALPIETQNYVPAVFNALARFGDNALNVSTKGPHLEQAVYATGER